MALSNSQYDEIMRAYEQKQLHNHDVLENRRQEIYRKVPGYQELDLSISRLSIAQAKARLLENESSGQFQEYQHQMQRLIAEKRELMTRYGYPEDYLDPVYQCPDCQDTGYIQGQKCHCLQKAIVDLLYAQSHLEDILKKENFQNFSFDYYSPKYIDPKSGRSSLAVMKEAYSSCQNFVQNFDSEFHNLFLYGDTGIGKTYLSNCIAKELIESAHSVIYFSAFELFDELADIRFQKGENEHSLAEYIYDCDLLIIDDLGTELVNSFVTSQLFLCLNERILRRKSTIISTNLSLGALTDTYSERIFSRITSNYTMLKLIGDDIRIKKKLRNVED
jgi:DNA replication protein DnaC